MKMRWTDLQPGDVLAISIEAFKQRNSEGWTRDKLWRESIFVVKKVDIKREDYIVVIVRDSKKETERKFILNRDDGSMVNYPGYPFFEILSLAEER